MKEYRFFKFKRYIAAMLFLVMTFGFAASAGADFSITAKAASKKKYCSQVIDGNVKVLFIGDSRTVDMFSAKRHEIKGEVHNNITVYAKDGAGYGYMRKTLKKVNLSDYDLVVSWMGANDRGNFKKYSSYYKKLNKKKGVNLVLCTIGYSDDRKLGDIGDILYYNNGIMQSYNKELTRWAKKNHVQTIDLYSYTKNHIRARDNNGVHYVPNPTVDLWNYTVKQINKKVENR